MSATGMVGIALGLFSLWTAAKALLTGTVDVVIFRPFQNWGPMLSTEFEREEKPFWYWAATVTYGAGGLFLVVLAASWGRH